MVSQSILEGFTKAFSRTVGMACGRTAAKARNCSVGPFVGGAVPMLESLEPRLLLSGGVTGIELYRGLHELNDFAEDNNYRYSIEVVGRDLYTVSVAAQWGSFSSERALLGWDGAPIDIQGDRCSGKAWTDSEGLEHVSVEWYLLSEYQWGQTGELAAHVTVEFIGGSWDDDVLGDGMESRTAPHYLTSPVGGLEWLGPQPTFEWPRWHAPAHSHIQLSVSTRASDVDEESEVVYDVRLGSDATQWTPPESLLGTAQGLNVDVRFETETTDRTEGKSWRPYLWSEAVPVTKHAFVETYSDFLIDEDVVTVGHHDGAMERGWSFTDDDGDIVTPVLTGPGWVELIFDSRSDDGGLKDIRFHGTDSGSRFRLDVEQQGAGDGRVELYNAVSSDGASLGELDVRQVDWVGDADGYNGGLYFRGAVGTLRLGDLVGKEGIFSEVHIESGSSGKMRLTAGASSGLDVEYWGPLEVKLYDGGFIHASRMGSLSFRNGYTGPEEIFAESGGIERISVVGCTLSTYIVSWGPIDSVVVKPAVVHDENGDAKVISGSIDHGAFNVIGRLGRIIVIGGDIRDSDLGASGGIGEIRVTGGDLSGCEVFTSGIGRILVEGGDISDCQITTDVTAIRQIHVVDGDLSDCQITTRETSVGKVLVEGGDLRGTHITSGVHIDSIVVEARVDYDEQGVGTVRGGNIMDSTITAGELPGQGPIGRIVVRGGDLGSEASWIEIKCSQLEAVSVEPIQYVAGTIEMPLLDERAHVQTDAGGDGVTRTSPLYGLWGGAAWVDIEAYRVKRIDVTGGALGGRIEAHRSIGQIRMQSVPLAAPYGCLGLTWVPSADQIAVADLLAEIVAGDNRVAHSISSINLRGGSIRGNVRAARSIGRIEASSLGIVNGDSPRLSGGSIFSKDFTPLVCVLKLGNPMEGIVPQTR